MKIKSVELNRFKRFSQLIISDLPVKAKLVVLAGPNGFGKSSLFDAFRVWKGLYGGGGWSIEQDYYDRKQGEEIPVNDQRRISVVFHGDQPVGNTPSAQRAFSLRSAFRNDPSLTINSLAKVGSSLTERRFMRMIDTDAAVTLNYQRLVSNAFTEAFDPKHTAKTLGVWQDDVIGELRESMQRLFPDLVLENLGSPLEDPTFRFRKGEISGFIYKNLSGGEKSALDLLLDIIVSRKEYSNTVFCIDEPETHINPRVYGALLTELLSLIPEGSQLWIATHAIGMLRRARDLEAQNPGTVVFLDFEGKDFDQPVELKPIRPTRTFWERALKVALDDIADLVAPREVVICEGSSSRGKNSDHDATCYKAIFSEDLPDTVFISGGNSHDVATDRHKIAEKLPVISKGSRVIPLIDRDDHSAEEAAELISNGTAVLARRNIEAYLYDDSVLQALCHKFGKPEKLEEVLAAKAEAIQRSVARGNALDDIKPAAPEIFQATKRILGLIAVGNENRAFERNELSPLITLGMPIYIELKSAIFIGS